MQTTASNSPVRGWVIWAVATLFVVYQLMIQNGFGAIAGDVRHDLDLSILSTGVLSASFLVVYSLMQLPVGLILDRANARLVLGCTALLCGLLAWLFSQADTLWEAIALRAGIGAAAAFAFTGAGVIARRWIHPSQFALAMGFIDFSFGMGAVIGDAGFELWLQHGTWRQLLAGMAVVGCGLGVLILLLVRNRPAERTDAPEPVPAPIPLRTSLRTLCSSRQVWLGMVFYAGMCGTMFSFGGLWNIRLQEAFGFSTPDAISLNSIMFLGMGLTAPCWGWLSDRWGRRKPILVLGAAGSVVMSAVIIFTPWVPYPWVAASMFVHGLFLGTSVLIFPSVCERINREFSGAAIGIVNAAGCFFGGVLQIVPSLLLDGDRLDDLGTFQRSMAIFTVFHVLAFIAALGLHETRPGWAREQRHDAPDTG